MLYYMERPHKNWLRDVLVWALCAATVAIPILHYSVRADLLSWCLTLQCVWAHLLGWCVTSQCVRAHFLTWFLTLGFVRAHSLTWCLTLDRVRAHLLIWCLTFPLCVCVGEGAHSLTVGPRNKIEVVSGRVPWCSSCLLDVIVLPGGGYPPMFFSLAPLLARYSKAGVRGSWLGYVRGRSRQDPSAFFGSDVTVQPLETSSRLLQNK